jgi:hypothetical protein
MDGPGRRTAQQPGLGSGIGCASGRLKPCRGQSTIRQRAQRRQLSDLLEYDFLMSGRQGTWWLLREAAHPRHWSVLRVAAFALALAVGFELKLLVSGKATVLSAALLALTLSAFILTIARDALDQSR